MFDDSKKHNVQKFMDLKKYHEFWKTSWIKNVHKFQNVHEFKKMRTVKEKKEAITRLISTVMETVKPEGHDEQHSFASFTCFTASPIIHDPTLTSSCAYVRRTDLALKSDTKDTSLDVYL